MNFMRADCLPQISGTQIMASGIVAFVVGRRAVVTGHHWVDLNGETSYVRAQFIREANSGYMTRGKPEADVTLQERLDNLSWLAQE